MALFFRDHSCSAAVILITLVQIFYIIYSYTFIPPEELSEIKEIRPIRHIALKNRPLDGYVVNLTLINKYCEPELYDTDYFDTYNIQDCLDYLDERENEYLVKSPDSRIKCSPDSVPMLFHVYWRGRINEKIALMIKSFLYTQPLDCALLNVWLDQNQENDFSQNSYIQPLLKFSPNNFRLRRWNLTEQLNYDSIYEGWEEKINRQIPTVGYSDLVRFVLLYRYGGMYVDADVLFLRDMRPIYHLNQEFAYRWSFWLNYNTAILRLNAKSMTSRAVVESAMEHKMNFHPFQIKYYLVKKRIVVKQDLDEHLYMMPTTLFDPLWLKVDLQLSNQVIKPNINDFYDAYKSSIVDNEFPDEREATTSMRNKKEFFRGAFTYHWHNQWESSITDNSWFGVLQRGYDEFINGQSPNMYNEYINEFHEEIF
ncbi:wd repeat and sof domain-containing protein 1 [Gigaspora margarita]|uniref:Wd repeat and sof domain-containing protein 1 n=1 Tax=Gigaspora margarita TaxID=4874 RepID=A0A8H4AIH1_GIGMA|nr:wd repeat and sof domain-containing protein 1 [Gigaspora margarita]